MCPMKEHQANEDNEAVQDHFCAWHDIMLHVIQHTNKVPEAAELFVYVKLASITERLYIIYDCKFVSAVRLKKIEY